MPIRNTLLARMRFNAGIEAGRSKPSAFVSSLRSASVIPGASTIACMSAIARHEVVALKLWQRQIDCVEQLSAEAVELRTQLAGEVVDSLRSCSHRSANRRSRTPAREPQAGSAARTDGGRTLRRYRARSPVGRWRREPVARARHRRPAHCGACFQAATSCIRRRRSCSNWNTARTSASGSANAGAAPAGAVSRNRKRMRASGARPRSVHAQRSGITRSSRRLRSEGLKPSTCISLSWRGSGMSLEVQPDLVVAARRGECELPRAAGGRSLSRARRRGRGRCVEPGWKRNGLRSSSSSVGVRWNSRRGTD